LNVKTIQLLLLMLLPGMLQAQQPNRENNKAAAQRAEADEYFRLARRHFSNLKLDSIKYYEKLLYAAADSADYLLGKGKYYYIEGSINAVKMEFSEGMKNYQSAMELFKKEKDSLYMGICYAGMGSLKNIENKRHESMKYLDTALTIFETIDDTIEAYGVYWRQGLNYLLDFAPDGAIIYLTKAMRIAERMGDSAKCTLVYYNIANLYMSLADYETAYLYAKKSIAPKPPAISKVEYRNRLGALITCCNQTGRFEEASSYIEAYEAISKPMGDAWGNMMLCYHKGTADAYSGNNIAAKAALHAARRIAEEVKPDPMSKANIDFELGKCYLNLGNTDSAAFYMLQANELAVSLNNRLTKMNCHDVLAEIYFQKQQYDLSIEHLRKFYLMKDAALNMNRQTVIQNLKTQYETEKKEQQIAVLQAEQQTTHTQMQLRLLELERQKQQLVIVTKEKALQHLNYLNTQALLDAESSKRIANEKALTISQQQKSLQAAELKLKKTALVMKENELQAERTEHNLYLLAGVLLAGAGAYAFYRFRKRKQQENRQALLAERLRLSRDLHDDIGSTLSSLNFYSEIATGKLKKQRQDEAMDILNKMGNASRVMTERISDLVWSINPENDSVQHTTDRLKSIAAVLFQHTDIRYLFDSKGIDEAIPLTIEQRKNLLLIYKEALNNIVKYAACKTVSVGLYLDKGRLTLSIKDDGTGFDAAQPGNSNKTGGNGLKNMEARARQIAGTLTVNSEKGKGTEIVLSFALT